jgi:hypothetical protein
MNAATRFRPWTVDKTQPRSLDHVANVFQSEVETITESQHRYKSSRWIASLVNSVRPNGADHQWRKEPPM